MRRRIAARAGVADPRPNGAAAAAVVDGIRGEQRQPREGVESRPQRTDAREGAERAFASVAVEAGETQRASGEHEAARGACQQRQHDQQPAALMPGQAVDGTGDQLARPRKIGVVGNECFDDRREGRFLRAREHGGGLRRAVGKRRFVRITPRRTHRVG